MKGRLSRIFSLLPTYENWPPPYISKELKLELKKIIKDKITERVDILWRIFERKNQKSEN